MAGDGGCDQTTEQSPAGRSQRGPGKNGGAATSETNRARPAGPRARSREETTSLLAGRDL